MYFWGTYGLTDYGWQRDGLEKGINDNARDRNIVVHSADYVSEEFIEKNQRLGRSWGCPALPEEGYKEVIELIKDKSLLFVFWHRHYRWAVTVNGRGRCVR